MNPANTTAKAALSPPGKPKHIALLALFTALGGLVLGVMLTGGLNLGGLDLGDPNPDGLYPGGPGPGGPGLGGEPRPVEPGLGQQPVAPPGQEADFPAGASFFAATRNIAELRNSRAKTTQIPFRKLHDQVRRAEIQWALEARQEPVTVTADSGTLQARLDPRIPGMTPRDDNGEREGETNREIFAIDEQIRQIEAALIAGRELPGQPSVSGPATAPGEASGAVPTAGNYSPEAVISPPTGPFLAPGQLIQAIIETPIDSDWSRRWTALVTRNTWDAGGRQVVIPEGTRLFGSVAPLSQPGQSLSPRIALPVEQALLPDNRLLSLESLEASGGDGTPAIGARVNHHWGSRFAGIAAYALFDSGNDPRGFSPGYSDRLSAAAGRAISPGIAAYANRPASKTIPAGTPITVIVSKFLSLRRGQLQ